MKTTTIIVSLICTVMSFYSIAQTQNSGSNQTFHNFKKEPIIRYSSINNKMYMLNEQFFNPGVFSLDTLNYNSQLWGNLSTSIVASDFVVTDNGDLVFVKQNGSDIELFSTDSNGQPLWSEISNGIVTGTISDLKLVRKGSSYWMYQNSDIYKFANNVWSQLLSPDPIHDLEVNSLDQPHVLNYYFDNTPGNNGGSHKIEFYDGANWQLRYDTTYYETSPQLISQFCINSVDSIYVIYSYPEGDTWSLWVPYVYLAELQGNTLVAIDSMDASAEEVTTVDILLDLNENPQCTYSTLGLGPWANISHHYWNGNSLIWNSDGIILSSDFPNHLAKSYSMAVDNYNCMHIAYDFHTDIFQSADTTHARVRKFCQCEYVNAQNSISQNGFLLTADVGLDVNYQWLDCDQGFSAIAGATNSTYDASSGGSFALQIEQNGCVDISECITVSGVGIDELDLSSQVHFYPNPTTGALKISISNNESVMVEVRDLTGKLMLEEKQMTHGESIDLKPLSPGTYFFKVTSLASQQTYSIVKL